MRGYTLLEILMVLVLLGVIGSLAATSMTGSVHEAKFQATLNEMKLIQKAMIGDVNLQTRGQRTDFGYLGDVGAMPAAIGDLISMPVAVTAWTRDNVRRIGHGWNGPYIRGSDPGADYTRDAWGNLYVYSPAAAPPTLVSLGADGAAGGTGLNQDITLEFPANHRAANVHGFLVDGGAGNPANVAATIEIYYPDGLGGLVTTTSTTTAVGDQGYFTFAGIPLGVRSALIDVAGTDYGPIIFNVDRAEYTIPVALTEVNTGPCSGITISFQAATSSSGEHITPANIVVEASATCAVNMTVDYSFTDGTATGGVEYDNTAGTVTILAGNLTENIPVTINDDGVVEANKDFTVTISNPLPSGANLGATTSHVFTILDNDACVPATVTVSANQTWTVPANCTNLVIHAWGGGGGAGGSSNGKSGDGGAGGYVYTGNITVTGGESYTVAIGGGGSGSNASCSGGGTGTYTGGAKGNGSNGGNGGGGGAGGTGGAAGSYAGGDAGYGGGGGGAGSVAGDLGGQGGGATVVVEDSGGSEIMIAGGGGGGGGGANGGGGSAGGGGPGCAQNGSASGNGNRGGGGGGGACFGPNTANGTGRTPSNSAAAGTAARGGAPHANCSNSSGSNGVVVFDYS